MNLAGVERVLELEELMDAMQAQLERVEPEASRSSSARCCARSSRCTAPTGASCVRCVAAEPQLAVAATRFERETATMAMRADRFTIKSQEAIQAAQRLAA